MVDATIALTLDSAIADEAQVRGELCGIERWQRM